MDVKIGQALEAYANGLARAQSSAGGAASGLGARDDAAPRFADLVRDAADSVVTTGMGAETASVKAIAKAADLTEVVTAVSNAELTLETVIAVRDRVIQAYQDIMRMPI